MPKHERGAARLALRWQRRDVCAACLHPRGPWVTLLSLSFDYSYPYPDYSYPYPVYSYPYLCAACVRPRGPGATLLSFSLSVSTSLRRSEMIRSYWSMWK